MGLGHSRACPYSTSPRVIPAASCDLVMRQRWIEGGGAVATHPWPLINHTHTHSHTLNNILCVQMQCVVI